MCKEESMPALVDARKASEITKAAIKGLVQKDAFYLVKAGGIIVGSKLQVLLGNAFLILNSPPMPSKLFNKKNKALKWLKKYKG